MNRPSVCPHLLLTAVTVTSAPFHFRVFGQQIVGGLACKYSMADCQYGTTINGSMMVYIKVLDNPSLEAELKEIDFSRHVRAID